MLKSPNASTLLLCPMCAARDIFDIDPTEHGELLYCADSATNGAPPRRRGVNHLDDDQSTGS